MKKSKKQKTFEQVASTSYLIEQNMDRVKELLLRKNKAYGNSATNPAKIFSKGNAVDSLCARIDDKLMRISNSGINENTLDTLDDLMGYFCLLRIAIKKQQDEV